MVDLSKLRRDISSDDLINIIKQSALKGRVDIPNGKKLKAGGISMPSLSADEVEKLTLAKLEFIPLNVFIGIGKVQKNYMFHNKK